jgi:hypothetical protein
MLVSSRDKAKIAGIIMITASSNITRCAPGRYQLSTVLKDLVDHCPGKRRTCTVAKKPRKKRYIKKVDRERIWRDTIYSLPDDEQELWRRVVL